MGYFYHRKVYSRMNCWHGYFFGDTIFPAFGPQEMLYFGVSKPMLWKMLHKHETNKGTGRLGWGAWKSTKSFQFLNVLCPTLHVQLPCETWGFIAGGAYQHDGAWGGVERRRFGAWIESLGVDFLEIEVRRDVNDLQEMMGEHVLIFLGWTFLYPLVLCFGACFTVSPSKRRSTLQSSFRVSGCRCYPSSPAAKKKWMLFGWLMRRVYRVKNHDAIELKFAILETLATDIPETHAAQDRAWWKGSTFLHRSS